MVDRGAFTNPPSSPIHLDEYARIIADVAQELLAQPVWTGFFAREREIVALDMREGVRQFWRAVVGRAAGVGEEPTILVPYDRLGEGVGLASHGLPNSDLDEFEVTRNDKLSGSS